MGMKVIAIALISVFLLPFILCWIDKIFKTMYSCKWFGWHNGDGTSQKTFDGCSVHSICSKCGKEVMQDSQGNWF